MKLAPSLHRIGSDLVNSYLVEDAVGGYRHRRRPARPLHDFSDPEAAAYRDVVLSTALAVYQPSARDERPGRCWLSRRWSDG